MELFVVFLDYSFNAHGICSDVLLSYLILVISNCANPCSFFLYFYLMATKKRETEVCKGDKFLSSDFLLRNHGHSLIRFLVDVLRKLIYYWQ